MYTEADRAELPKVQSLSPDGMNPFDDIARIRGSPRGIPAHSRAPKSALHCDSFTSTLWF